MTPEQIQQLNELTAWMNEKKQQQITAPLDEASRNSLGAAVGRGLGSTANTQTITIPSGGGTATVPANPIGTVLIEIEGVRYEVAYIATP